MILPLGNKDGTKGPVWSVKKSFRHFLKKKKNQLVGGDFMPLMSSISVTFVLFLFLFFFYYCTTLPSVHQLLHTLSSSVSLACLFSFFFSFSISYSDISYFVAVDEYVCVICLYVCTCKCDYIMYGYVNIIVYKHLKI